MVHGQIVKQFDCRELQTPQIRPMRARQMLGRVQKLCRSWQRAAVHKQPRCTRWAQKHRQPCLPSR